MKKRNLLLAFIISCLLSCAAFAQGTVQIRKVKVVPAVCDATGTNSDVMVWKIAAPNAGLYLCVSGTYQYQTNTFGSGLTAKTMLYASAAPVGITSTTAPTNGQLLVGDTGNVPALATLTGTSNETLITNAAHSITIGLAAAVQHRAGANFLLTDTSDTAKKFQFIASVITTANTRSITVPDSDTTLPIASKVITFTGPTANLTVTLPDRNLTVGETLLETTGAVNMNTATATTLWTSPSGQSTIITRVVVSACSTSMTTASYSFGWNSATFNDVVANATHTELTGATLYTALAPAVGAKIGTSTGTFKVLMNTLQGGAATCKMDVFGYTF